MARKNERIGSRYRVLRKLYLSGCKTEKDLLALSLEEVLRMKNITVSDMVMILDLQKHVKTHTLYSYLGGDISEMEH